MVRTAGSWLVIGALGAAALGWPMACKPGSPDTNVPATGVADVLAAVGPEVVLPTLARFRADAVVLRDRALEWADAADAGSDTEPARADARAAWRAAMLTWQEAEVMQIGPAAPALTAVGGQDVRDAIYSWPTTNPCRVDQETVEAVWDEPDWFTVNLVNSYGLDALEHLLHAGPENVCPGQIDINANGTWDALGPAGVEANRAAFTAALADDLIRRTDALIAAWEGGSFALTTDVFDSEQEALNAVYDGLFYIEKPMKDRKLAEPAGLGACTTDCLDLVELKASGLSTEAVRSNLRGFRLLFTGGDGFGMDELLRQNGHGDLADQVLAATERALQEAEALGAPLDEAMIADPASGQRLHDAVKELTDLVKGDLAVVLALQVPAEASGDND